MSFTNSKQQTARKPFRVLMVTGAYPTADDLSDPSAYIYRYVLTYYQSTMSARTISTYMTGWFQITCLVFVNEGSLVIESTSGNLGVALSFFCKLKGYKFVAVIDPKTTQENIAKMQALGAQIDMVDRSDENDGYLLSRLERVRELCQSSHSYVWTDHYSNPANPRIHYQSTDPEIYRQMQGEADALFIAVSTSGTLAGVGRFFREVSPSSSIIGVDAHGSVVFGTPPAPRKLTGMVHPDYPGISREICTMYICL